MYSMVKRMNLEINVLKERENQKGHYDILGVIKNGNAISYHLLRKKNLIPDRRKHNFIFEINLDDMEYVLELSRKKAVESKEKNLGFCDWDRVYKTFLEIKDLKLFNLKSNISLEIWY